MKTRFAPSPSGHLHVGGARTALFNYAFARRHGGRFLLRIEDTDRKRSSDRASMAFLEDLAWLGIEWQEGPIFEHGDRRCGGGEDGPYLQSERREIYRAHLDRLVEQGAAYYAFDTPEELAEARAAARADGRAFKYDRSVSVARSPEEVQARLDAGEPAVIRFRVPDGAVTIRDAVLGDVELPDGEIEDFVIRKADGYPTYHFAVVVDDETMGVTHVLRAQEHFNNTGKHMLLQDALGFSRPVFGHLPLIFNADGSKMSKRDKDKALRAAVTERGVDEPPAGTVDRDTFEAWRADKKVQLDVEQAERLAEALGVSLPEINVEDFRRSGYLPEVLINFLALNGWSPGGDLEKFDMAFLCEQFDLDRVMKTPARFDRQKLLAFNLDALQALSADAFVEHVRAHGREFHPDFMERLSDAQFELLARASQSRSKTLDDPFRTSHWVIESDERLEWTESKPVRKAMRGGPPSGLDHLRTVRPILESLDEWSVKALEAALDDAASTHADGQLGRIAQPLRIAVTGGPVSPSIHETLAILGRESALRRIDRCLEWAEATVAG